MSLSEYYILGRSGLRVSQIALGTMTFGKDWGWGSDEQTAREIFNTYIDAGGNFIDTADLYTNGTSETWVGKFIAERKLRDRTIVTTKFSYSAEPSNPNASGNGRKNMLRAVDSSLRRLGTDYIDLYELHTWDRLTPAEEVMRTFDDLVRSGKVRYVGLSDTPAWYAARAQTLAEWRGYEPLCSLQLEYSLVERNIEREFMPLGLQLGMGITAWSPLANGFLTGKYSQDRDANNSGRLDTLKNDRNPALQKFTPRNWEILAELRRVAQSLERSMAQVAIAWTASQPGVAATIIGATTKSQLADNLQALDFEIPPELMTRLDTISRLNSQFPYSFFEPEIQHGLHGEKSIGAKPNGYFPNNAFAPSLKRSGS